MASASDITGARDARGEARDLVGSALDPRVLEPSPPAVDDGEWFADDPVDVGDAASPLVPAGMGDPDWSSWVDDHPEHEAWVAQRWLGGRRRLPSTPESLVATRLSLHRLGAYVIAPARHAATTKFGLRFTLGGFGTPFFGPDRQIRVVGDRLVDQRGATADVAPITTLRAASEFLGSEIRTDAGAEHDSPPLDDIDEPLAIDTDAAAFLGAWFGMAFAALERVRADAGSTDPSRPQLWPGHFDPAIEVGDEDHRASYGASPGDHNSPEPYLYVSVWWPDRLDIDPDDPFWNATAFTGAVLPFSSFGDDTDPVDAAVGFWLGVRDELA